MRLLSPITVGSAWRGGPLIAVLLLAMAPRAQAQWSNDPAQAGATAYCTVLNQGLGVARAEEAATQAMAEVLQLASGAVLAGLQLNNPLLVTRWRDLVDNLCPDGDEPDPSEGLDDGLWP